MLLLVLLLIATLLPGSTSFQLGQPNTTDIECQEDYNCSTCYIAFVRHVMHSDDNVYNLSRVFLPPTELSPVFVIVNYNFEGGEHKRWYWTLQTSTLIHPLEGFQFFSFFFGDFSSRVDTVNLTLPNECYNASEGYYELLTQRLKVHASTQKVIPTFEDEYTDDANSANFNTLERKIHSNLILIAILYLYQIVAPLFISLTSCYVVFSLTESIDSVLPKTKLDRNSVALSVLTVCLILYLFAIGMDITGIWFATTMVEDNSEYSQYSHGDSGINALFLLPVLFLLLYDVGGFIAVCIFILCPCICRTCCNYHKFTASDLSSSKWKHTRVRLVAITGIIFVFANHSYYIILGLINDPLHGHSIGIYLITTLAVYLICFKVVWKKVLKRNEEMETLSSVKIEKSINNRGKKITGQGKHNEESVSKVTRTGCITVLGVSISFILFQILATATFVYLPVKRTVEEIPTQINAMYQSLIVLFTALITYKLFIEPKRDYDVLEDILEEMRMGNEWVTVCGKKKLTNKDKKYILKKDFWLDDRIIHAAMLLIEQYAVNNRIEVHGLVDPVLLDSTESKDQYKGSLKPNGLQILNTGRNHWITVSTTRTTAPAEGGDQQQCVTVHIYDSLKKLNIKDDTKSEQLEESKRPLLVKEGSRLQHETKSLIEHLVGEESTNIDWDYHPNVQKQDNGSDCGLFAIAFAFEICKGEDAALAQGRKFDTKKMRKHLVDCFENGVMESFPP